MSFTLLKRTTSCLPIGVDVGEAGLRLVQLQEEAGGLRVHRVAVWARDLGDRASEVAAALEERLERFAKQTGFDGKSAICGLTAPHVELHPLELPIAGQEIRPADLQKAASWEIQRLTTMEHDRLETATWRLPESKRAKATYMGVAAPRARIDERLALCHAAGLECVRIDVSSCALATLIWRLRRGPAKQVWGVLDLGNRGVRLTICIADIPVLVRSFDMGGWCWTQQISAALKLSEGAAERNKREFGLSAPRQDPGGSGAGVRAGPGAPEPVVPPRGAGQELSAMILGILRDDLQRLCLEMERSYEYVLQCFPAHTAGDLIMVGGGALLKGLSGYLAGRLGIEVMPVSQCPAPETQAVMRGLPSNASLEVCAVACGLSLQGAAVDA